MTTYKGFDCATPLTYEKALEFKNQGFVYVGRYGVPYGWKALTRTEVENITKAGLLILNFFELTGGSTKGGAKNGESDGKIAFETAQKIGQPLNTGICFTVDYDTTPSDYDVIEAYLKAAKLQIKGYQIGVYGEADVVTEMKKREVVDFIVDTLAWSHGKIADGITAYQKQNDINVNGIGVDLEDGYDLSVMWNLNQIGGDEEEMKLKDWEWTMLANTLDGWHKAGIITDQAWVDKAKNHNMDLSEYVFLLTECVSRLVNK